MIRHKTRTTSHYTVFLTDCTHWTNIHSYLWSSNGISSINWGCLSRMQPRMLASRRSPPHEPHNPVILTFSQSQYKYFSHQHEKWLKYLYCDWVKNSMTSEKPSKDWEGFSDAAGRKIFRFSFRRHRICLGRFFLDWEGFSLAGTRVPQFFEALQEYLPEKSPALA